MTQAKTGRPKYEGKKKEKKRRKNRVLMGTSDEKKLEMMFVPHQRITSTISIIN